MGDEQDPVEQVAEIAARARRMSPHQPQGEYELSQLRWKLYELQFRQQADTDAAMVKAAQDAADAQIRSANHMRIAIWVEVAAVAIMGITAWFTAQSVMKFNAATAPPAQETPPEGSEATGGAGR